MIGTRTSKQTEEQAVQQKKTSKHIKKIHKFLDRQTAKKEGNIITNFVGKKRRINHIEKIFTKTET